MKLHDSKAAPNPRRVRIFLAEKGIEVPLQEVNIGTAENRQAPFLEMNALGGLPVLELDDGRCLAETVAICRYFEGVQPEPALMGVDAVDAAFVEMWNRRMELNVFNSITGTFRHTHDFFKGRITQVPDYGEACREAANKHFDWLNDELANREFIAGDRFTIADITLLCGIDFGAVTKIQIKAEQKNLQRWHDSVSSRPSAKA